MGFYTSTYVCFGTFTDKTDAAVIEKMQVASIDGIIEASEWKRGVVKLSEIEKHAKTWNIH